jgi:hypothetical protein
MAYPRYIVSRSHKRISLVSGDLGLVESATWQEVSGDLTILIRAQEGDDIEFGISANYGHITGEFICFDVATMVGSTPIHYFGTGGTGFGVTGWYYGGGIPTSDVPLSGSVIHTLDMNDIDSMGIVKLSLRYRASDDFTLFANADAPFQIWAKNLGPADDEDEA